MDGERILSAWEVLGITNGVDLVWALGTLLLALGFSIWLDRRTGVPFRVVAKRVNDDARAAAMYYGFRWLGVCILVGAAVY